MIFCSPHSRSWLLAPPQKLKDVADEFEKDLHQQRLAEAQARAAEAEALRERIAELEEENAGGWVLAGLDMEIGCFFCLSLCCG